MRNPLLLLACLAGAQLFAADSNWPQFRGPSAGGVAAEANLPVTWNVETGENIAWKAEVPGLAHSSPIVWDHKVYVTTAVRSGEAELKVGLYGDIDSVPDEGKVQWRLLAFDLASGKQVFNELGYEGAPRSKRHPKSSHCSSTPATDGKRIVAMFGSEGLFCFDMDGRQKWKKDLGQLISAYYVVPSAQWGFASSPVIHDGKVIVLCDVLQKSFLACFDLEDGHEIWKVSRNDVPTWGTPAIVTAAGRTQVVVNGWHRSGGYDFATGNEIWHLDGGGDIPVPTPIAGNDFVYLTSAHGKFRPMRAIRFDATGDITPRDIGATNQAIAWAYPRQGNYMQTPILVGGNLFACNDYGVITCFDARSGEISFSERIGGGNQGFTASPVAASGKLYFPSEIGNVVVVAAKPEFSVLATNALNETCMASPAIADGKLLFRTRRHLIAVASSK